MDQQFDRTSEDAGNIVLMEHVNTRIPDQSQAHLFYVTGMGFTRDPYLDFGMRNMWINLGRQQFHLPSGEPQVLRGRIGLVVPSLDELERRLEKVARSLEGTALSWARANSILNVTTPWGNALVVHEPGQFGKLKLGMPYVQFDVGEGSAAGIARFYEEILATPASVVDKNEETIARIFIGQEQTLEYRETPNPMPAYDGHHIAVYISDFSGSHDRLLERNLIAQESNAHQFRFNWIVDPENNEKLFEVEHEVRSLTHPMFGRPLVNRNPNQTLMRYERGLDQLQV